MEGTFSDDIDAGIPQTIEHGFSGTICIYAGHQIGSLIQSAASRLRSTISALAGRASISGGATSGTNRITNVKVKSL